MFEHKLAGFTILDLGCLLSKDDPAIQENKVKNFRQIRIGSNTYQNISVSKLKS